LLKALNIALINERKEYCYYSLYIDLDPFHFLEKWLKNGTSKDD